jgi:hypothetical protein
MSVLDDIAKFAPTIGGVLGGIGGEIIDPVGGGIVGAGLGSSLGRGIENTSQGKGFVGSDDLTAGLEGAAGQGVGDAIGGAVGAVGGAASKYGEGVANQATQAASDAADAEKVAAQGQAGIDKATATKANFGSLSPLKQKLNNLGGNQDFVESMGKDATNPYDMRDVAQGGYEINNAVGKALNGVQIDTSGAANPLLKLVQAGETQTPEANAIMRAFRTANVPLGPNGEVPKTLDATTVRQLTQSLGKEIGDQQVRIEQVERNGFNATPMKEELQSLQDARNDFVGGLSSNDQINENIKNTTVTPEHQSVLAEKYGEPLANHIATTINGAENYNDIIPEMQRFAQMGTASDTAIDDIERVSGTDRAVQRAKLAGDATKPVTAKNVADKTAADHLLDAAASGASGRKGEALGSVFKAGAKARGPVASKVGSLLERISPFTSDKGISDVEPMLHTGILNKVPGALGATALTSPNVAQGATAMNPQPLNTQSGQGTMGTSQGGQMSPYANIMQMIETDPAIASSLAPIANSYAPSVQKAQTAEAQLPALAQSFQAAGGAQGPLGGLLAKIGSAFGGGETAKYTAQQKEVMSLLQSLGISPANVPSITESPQAAQAGLSQIQGGLSGVLAGVPAQ